MITRRNLLIEFDLISWKDIPRCPVSLEEPPAFKNFVETLYVIQFPSKHWPSLLNL